MCETGGRMSAGSTPGSAAEALRTAVACLDYLIPLAPGLPAAANAWSDLRPRARDAGRRPRRQRLG